MDLTFTDEQRLLSEAVRHFAQQVCTTAVVREVEGSESGYSADLWTKLCELGYPGIALPESYGGSGGTMLDLTILAEELGRVAFPSPLLTSVALGALPLLWAGTEEQRRRWLPSLVNGDVIATMALVEHGGGDEWSEVRLVGRKQGADWRISGVKILVPYAATAHLLLIAATLEGPSLSLIALERDAAGVTCERHRAIGGDPLYTVSFENV